MYRLGFGAFVFYFLRIRTFLHEPASIESRRLPSDCNCCKIITLIACDIFDTSEVFQRQHLKNFGPDPNSLPKHHTLFLEQIHQKIGIIRRLNLNRYMNFFLSARS